MIEFIDVTKKYGDNIGLENANIRINKGDFVFLVGPSGAGKSTFIKLILREIPADSGQILVDGMDISDVLLHGAPSPHEELYWEMEQQTAIRQGKYKLVLNGQLVESEPAQAPVFLSDLSVDPGETVNLAEQMPELTQELTRKATAWRAGIEDHWEKTFAEAYRSTT